MSTCLCFTDYYKSIDNPKWNGCHSSPNIVNKNFYRKNTAYVRIEEEITNSFLYFHYRMNNFRIICSRDIWYRQFKKSLGDCDVWTRFSFKLWRTLSNLFKKNHFVGPIQHFSWTCYLIFERFILIWVAYVSLKTLYIILNNKLKNEKINTKPIDCLWLFIVLWHIFYIY